MPIEKRQCDIYIQEITSIKGRLTNKLNGDMLQSLGEQASKAVEKICREQRLTDDCLLKYVQKFKAAVTPPNGQGINNSANQVVMRARLEAELEYFIDDLKAQVQPVGDRAGNAYSDSRFYNDPKAIKQLQEQLETASRERDKANADMIEEKKLSKKLTDIANELRQQQSERSQQQEQEYAAKLSQVQQQFRDELQQAELEHSGRVAALKNEYNVELQRKEAQLTESAQNLQKSANTLKQVQADKDRAEQAALTLAARVEELESKPGVSTDPNKNLEGLQTNQTSLPSALNTFVTAFCEIAKLIQSGDKSQIRARLLSKEGLDLLDEYVYGLVPAYGRLASETQSAEQADQLRTALLQVTALQTWAHQQLVEQELVRLINPPVGAEFQSNLHAAAEADYVWINTEPERHNRVAGVKRIGYEAEDEVLRRAQVKRFVFAGSHLTGIPETSLALAAENTHSVSPSLTGVTYAAEVPNSSEPEPLEALSMSDEPAENTPDAQPAPVTIDEEREGNIPAMPDARTTEAVEPVLIELPLPSPPRAEDFELEEAHSSVANPATTINMMLNEQHDFDDENALLQQATATGQNSSMRQDTENSSNV